MSDAPVKKDYFSMFVVFGMSLFSVWPGEGVLPVTVSASDVVFVIVLLYSIKRVGLVASNPISNAAILLAFILLVSGLVNKVRMPTFDEVNFLVNYIRVMALVAAVFLLPPLLRRIGEDRLAMGTMFALRFHCVALLADSFHLIPSDWLPLGESRSTRPGGLFAEPGWFGTWVGLSVFYIIQLQRNLEHRYLTPFDIGLLSVSIIASAGMRGVFLFGAAMMLLMMNRRGGRLTLVGGILPVLVVVGSIASMVPSLGLSSSFVRVLERLSNISPTNIQDDSVLDRLVSTTQAVTFTMHESPLLGLGLGGTSQQSLPWYDSVLGVSGSSMMPVTIFLAGGLLGLIVFLYMMLKIIMTPETRWFGLGFTLTAIMWGGAFETFIWWFIALAITLMKQRKVIKSVFPMTASMEIS